MSTLQFSQAVMPERFPRGPGFTRPGANRHQVVVEATTLETVPVTVQSGGWEAYAGQVSIFGMADGSSWMVTPYGFVREVPEGFAPGCTLYGSADAQQGKGRLEVR